MAGSSSGAMPGSSSGAMRGSSSGPMRGRAGPAWVQEVKKRMPRHQEWETEEDWFLKKTHRGVDRWFEAQLHMDKQRGEGVLSKMADAFDKIRRDLSLKMVAWYPQKWTTMVEGRPVQVEPCILPYNPSAEPDACRAKSHGHGGVEFCSQKPISQKQSLFMSGRCHEKYIFFSFPGVLVESNVSRVPGSSGAGPHP